MPPTPLTMNHLDRIKQDRELIGLNNFKSLSLDQLLDAIDQKFPTGLGRKRIIQIFITWLHDCLVDSEISDSPTLRSQVREWVTFLRKCHNSDRTILDTFREYQNYELNRIEENKLKDKEAEKPRAAKRHTGGNQAEEGKLEESKAVDSKSKDRTHEEPVPAKAKLSIIAIELQKYLKSSSAQNSVSESISAPPPAPLAPGSAAMAPPPDPRYGYMHPDRMPALSDSRYNITQTHRMGPPPGPRPVQKQPERVTPRPEVAYGNMHPDRMPLLSKLRPVRAQLNGRAPPPEVAYGQMHPDRMKISQKLHSEIETNCDDDLQTTGYLSKNARGGSDNFHNEHPELKRDLSFLTGSNRMVLDDTVKVRDPVLRSKNKSSGDDSGHEVKKPRLEEQPRVGGRNSCGLCGGSKKRPSFVVQQTTDYHSDHFLPKDCPAKFDPQDGGIPHRNYKCAVCKRFGAHYTVDCPKKKDTGVDRMNDHQNPNPQANSQFQREEQRPSSRDGLYQQDPLQRQERSKHRISSSGQKLVDKDVKTSFQPSGHGHGSLTIKGVAPTSDRPLSRGKHNQIHSKEHLETIQERSKSIDKKVAVAGDLVVQHKVQTEGRLSFYDEKHGQRLSKSIQAGSLSVLGKPSQTKKKKEYIRLVSPVPGSAPIVHEIERAQLDDLVMEMIKSESNKPNLSPTASLINPIMTRLSPGRARANIVEDQFSRLWVNTQDNLRNAQQTRSIVGCEEAGIPIPGQSAKLSVNNALKSLEPETPWDSFVYDLFKNREISWTTKKRRPCAADLFGPLADIRKEEEEKPIVYDIAIEIEQCHAADDQTANILATPSSTMELDKSQRDPKPVNESAVKGLQHHERVKSEHISEIEAHADEPFTQSKPRKLDADSFAGVVSDSTMNVVNEQQPAEMAVDEDLIKTAVVEAIMETMRPPVDHFRCAEEVIQEKQNGVVIDSIMKVTFDGSIENEHDAVKASLEEQYKAVLAADNLMKAAIESLDENSQAMEKTAMGEQITKAVGGTVLGSPRESSQQQLKAEEQDLNITVIPEAVMGSIAASPIDITMDLEQAYSPLAVTTQDDDKVKSSQTVMDGLEPSDFDFDPGHSVVAHQEENTAAIVINRDSDSIMLDDATIEPDAGVRDY